MSDNKKAVWRTLDNASNIIMEDRGNHLSLDYGKEDFKIAPYSGLLQNIWDTSILSPDLSRNIPKVGMIGLDNTDATTTVESLADGGDYFNGNVAKVSTAIFKVGEIKKFRFKFYDLTVPTSPIPITYNNKDSYNIPNVISIFSNIETIKSGVGPDKFKFLCDIYLDENNEDNNGLIYTVSESLVITPEIINAVKGGFIFANLTNLKPEKEAWKDGTTIINFNDFRLGGSAFTDNVVPKLGMCALPRGSRDVASYIVLSSAQSGGIAAGQTRLLDFDYNTEVDLVREFLGENTKKHHLDVKDNNELNYMRYSAPPILTSGSFTDKKAKIVCTKTSDFHIVDEKWTYISHESLTRGRFNLTNKKINSIVIPYMISSDVSDYHNERSWNKMFSAMSGIIHNNRRISIAQTEGPDDYPTESDWIASENFVAFSYFKDYTYYTFTFENSDQLLYKGKGIWIAGNTAPGENKDTVDTSIPLICYKVADNSYYQYRVNGGECKDFVYAAGPERINTTPNIKIFFDYQSRSDWFDYLEWLAISTANTTSALYTEVASQNLNQN